ncbi:hypothetical protein CFBP4996_15310 [Agrobacterium leguminum]|uniref:Uncharacterized protein n=1 Tax=Agrobacterium deltaense NCPPB 1641 TaxID=1183425 RepID=A0A1S7U2Q2_9HYPH|nr:MULTISPECIES: hypothetical protein [Agrobacterium]WFS67395.1 hypothetical protein CFBP4996_15310 [Agrobacterium leguminum]CVI61041.1 membrane hypothetical protein [Agrobacterium deltaense NCPPB 1641]
MTNFDDIINFLFALVGSPFAAGLAGGYVRAILLQESNIIKTTVSTFTGGICAYYITPGLLKYGDLSGMSSGEIGTISFVVGLVGIYAAEGLIRLAIRYANNPTIPSKQNIAEIVETISKPKENEKE